MNVAVNGESREIKPGATLTELIALLALTGKRLAVELNSEIVPRSQHATTALHEGDRVEIVQAIGGG